ncbi:uncharacterized protein [Haliotis asinina]|uniref:uncharacterized protein n=1 Tax=Haliotis asinina TaxID=109174 RepID=UPI0035324789
MAKFVAIVAVVTLMILFTEAKESDSTDQRAAAVAAEVSRQARSVSDVIARAMKRSNKNSKECADFGDECSFWTNCCEGMGLECQADNDSWLSKGTCWMKY